MDPRDGPVGDRFTTAHVTPWEPQWSPPMSLVRPRIVPASWRIPGHSAQTLPDRLCLRRIQKHVHKRGSAMSKPLVVGQEPHDATLGSVGLMFDGVKMNVVGEELDCCLNDSAWWGRAGTEWQDTEDGIFPAGSVQLFTNCRGEARSMVGRKPDRRTYAGMVDKQGRATPVATVPKVNVVNHAGPVSDKRGWPWLIVIVAITVVVVIVEEVVSTTTTTTVGEQWGYLVPYIRTVKHASGPCFPAFTPQLAAQRGKDLRQRVEFRVR